MSMEASADKAEDGRPTQAGVQGLIDRLRAQGIDAGRAEANQLLAQARGEADGLIQAAREEADRIVADARTTAERQQRSAEEALRLAVRDAILSLKAELTDRFITHVRDLIEVELHEPEVLRSLILEVAGRAREEVVRDHPIAIHLPRTIKGVEELRQNPSELREDPLSRVVLELAGEQLREGVEIKPAEAGTDGHARGIRVRLLDNDVEVDLTDEAIASYLMAHLLPRFRAMMEGVIG